MLKFFADKMWVAFAKLLTFFQQKISEYFVLNLLQTVNEMTLNELVKLTTLWTTGPWSFQGGSFVVPHCLCVGGFLGLDCVCFVIVLPKLFFFSVPFWKPSRKHAHSNILKILHNKGKFSDKKNLIFFIFLLKHRLWVLVRTASAKRF